MPSLPPHLPPFALADAGREYVVRPADHGKILFLGNASDGRVGTFVVQWVPDASFSGSFAVTGRVYGKPASDKGVPFDPIPYRRVTLANVASDRALVSDTLTTSFLIEVPSNGINVGFLCACTGGFGTLFSWPLNGPAT